MWVKLEPDLNKGRQMKPDADGCKCTATVNCMVTIVLQQSCALELQKMNKPEN